MQHEQMFENVFLEAFWILSFRKEKKKKNNVAWGAGHGGSDRETNIAGAWWWQ